MDIINFFTSDLTAVCFWLFYGTKCLLTKIVRLNRGIRTKYRRWNSNSDKGIKWELIIKYNTTYFLSSWYVQESILRHFIHIVLFILVKYVIISIFNVFIPKVLVIMAHITH